MDLQVRYMENIRIQREKRGWSQHALSALLGIPRNGLWQLETGRRRLLYHEAVILADAFGVKLECFKRPVDKPVDNAAA
jgi:transcriptional regulator with XRE-family HTH domain